MRDRGRPDRMWKVDSYVHSELTTPIASPSSMRSFFSLELPQYLKEANWASENHVIACTQPRRVAATTVAARVAEEVGSVLGDEVSRFRISSSKSAGICSSLVCVAMYLEGRLLDSV